MKIDLQKLGLTKESTFEEIQTAINGVEAFTAEEVKASNDTAAAGARKAALASAQNKANTLSDEEMKSYKEYKTNKKMETLKSDETLKKLKEEDFELVIKANGLLGLEGEELETAIKDIATKEAKRFKVGLPEEVEKDGPKEDDEDLPFDPDDF